MVTFNVTVPVGVVFIAVVGMKVDDVVSHTVGPVEGFTVRFPSSRTFIVILVQLSSGFEQIVLFFLVRNLFTQTII